MEIAQALCAAIETALNRTLALDPETLSNFSRLEARVISIEILGINQTVSFFPSADGFLMLLDFDGDEDAKITGSPMALVKLGLADDARDLISKGEIVISGDVAIANQFNQLLSQLNIDWEEWLSSKIGDIAAHKLGNLFHDAHSWFGRNKTSACLDAGEYLQEEIKLSPANAELRQFIKQVDELREACDRFAARIAVLENK